MKSLNLFRVFTLTLALAIAVTQSVQPRQAHADIEVNDAGDVAALAGVTVVLGLMAVASLGAALFMMPGAIVDDLDRNQSRQDSEVKFYTGYFRKHWNTIGDYFSGRANGWSEQEFGRYLWSTAREAYARCRVKGGGVRASCADAEKTAISEIQDRYPELSANADFQSMVAGKIPARFQDSQSMQDRAHRPGSSRM